MASRSLAPLPSLLLPLLLVVVALTASASAHTERIMGGTPVSPKDKYPWIAALFRWDGSFICGGTLIGSQYVLTAAHCIESDNPADFTIQFKRWDLTATNETGITTTVSQAVIHPAYTYAGGLNDLAVLKLKTPVTGITPIKLDSTGSFNSVVNTPVTVIGYGATKLAGDPTLLLEEVTLSLWSFTQCRSYYADGGFYITSTACICAGTVAGGKDSCQGDSGGPLFVTANGTVTQIGVVSNGDGCGGPSVPGIYANVFGLRDFITNATDPSATFNACASKPCASKGSIFYCVESTGGKYFCGSGAMLTVLKVLTIGLPILLLAFLSL